MLSSPWLNTQLSHHLLGMHIWLPHIGSWPLPLWKLGASRSRRAPTLQLLPPFLPPNCLSEGNHHLIFATQTHISIIKMTLQLKPATSRSISLCASFQIVVISLGKMTCSHEQKQWVGCCGEREQWLGRRPTYVSCSSHPHQTNGPPPSSLPMPLCRQTGIFRVECRCIPFHLFYFPSYY